jgi:hypothetical protein
MTVQLVSRDYPASSHAKPSSVAPKIANLIKQIDRGGLESASPNGPNQQSRKDPVQWHLLFSKVERDFSQERKQI